MKKYIAILLVLVLTITCFAACGNNGKDEPKVQKKVIGLLYNVSEDASAQAIADAKAFLDEKGIAYKEYTGTNASEVSLAVDSAIADKVSAIFTPTDNTIMAAELSIYEKLAAAGIPHFTGADSFALNGAYLGYGVDYANLGKETANMIAEVLIDGKDTATLPVKTFDNGTATINTEICEKLGYDLAEMKAKYEPNCQAIKEIKTGNAFDDGTKDIPAAALKSGKLGAENAEKIFTIGICNLVDDASLNQIVANIKFQLDTIGKEKNVAFDVKYQNCNLDFNVLDQIIAGFKADKVDLMVGVATPVAMAMKGATDGTDTPVIFAAVSNPVNEDSPIVASMDAPGGNITGTSDYLDTKAIFNLILATIGE